MTPLPRFASWDAFNGHLEEQCRNRQGNVLRGHRESIGERFVRDREALKRPLPAPFDACDKQGTRVNSLSLVRYRTNDYSVPVAYGHQEVWIRGYVHEVVIGCGAGIIARHPRSYDREDMVFDPIHYLPLLEHKIGALDQAAPLAGWELPDAFPTLRRLLEARMGKAGKREYVQVLRLVETFDLEVLHGAVKDALRLGAISERSGERALSETRIAQDHDRLREGSNLVLTDGLASLLWILVGQNSPYVGRHDLIRLKRVVTGCGHAGAETSGSLRRSN